MRFTASDELVAKIVPRSHGGFEEDALDEFTVDPRSFVPYGTVGENIGERVLMAVDVFGGTIRRFNRQGLSTVYEVYLFEHPSFLEELASSIGYDGFSRVSAPPPLGHDAYFSQIVDLVKRDLYHWLAKRDDDILNCSWGYLKAADQDRLILSIKP